MPTLIYAYKDRVKINITKAWYASFNFKLVNLKKFESTISIIQNNSVPKIDQHKFLGTNTECK